MDGLPATHTGRREAELPFLSVIVPVRNEERFLAATLGQVLCQDYPAERFEVLVADGRSTDRTREIVAELQRQHPNLRLLDNPGRLSSAGRNVAVRAARGELVLLIDGHCELDGPGHLRAVANAFARSGADCLGRPQPLDVTGATSLQQAIALARSSPLGHHPASHIYSDREGFVAPQSVAVAYRRSVFEQVGLFDETFDACEDVELNQRVARAGLRCFFTPQIAVRYHPRGTLTGLIRQMVRYGRGRVRLLRKHPETFGPLGFVPAAFVAGVLLGPLACLAWPLLWSVYGGTLLLYAALILAASVLAGTRAPALRVAAWLPLVFAAVHAGAGLGLWLEAVAGFNPKRRRGSLHTNPQREQGTEGIPRLRFGLTDGGPRP
jgi:succinoglycan biosynthesis protein ExoA